MSALRAGNTKAGLVSFTLQRATSIGGKLPKRDLSGIACSEYAEVFKTVCVDAAYYDFPRREYLHKLADAVPDDFRFGLKITDAITIRKYPNLARFGAKAGQPNRDFLNADLLATAFLKPCEEIRPKVGVLMFEFSRFWPSDYEHGRDFVADLDTFLGKLPQGWPYAIETAQQGLASGRIFRLSEAARRRPRIQ